MLPLRKARPGWDVHGNEVLTNVVVPALSTAPV